MADQEELMTETAKELLSHLIKIEDDVVSTTVGKLRHMAALWMCYTDEKYRSYFSEYCRITGIDEDSPKTVLDAMRSSMNEKDIENAMEVLETVLSSATVQKIGDVQFNRSSIASHLANYQQS